MVVLVGLIVDRLGRVVHKGLTEDSGTGSVEFALAVAEVSVESEPALEGFLVDIGAEEELVVVVVSQQTLVLLHVHSGSMGELLATSADRNAVAVRNRSTGNLIEPVCLGAVLVCGCIRKIILYGVVVLLRSHRHRTREQGLH